MPAADLPPMYTSLAGWWPLISPVEEYAEEGATVRALLRSAAIDVREVLELGSGGGHLAAHLTGGLSMTLVDLSPDMLAISRRLNPGCAHDLGDMRSVRLGREFDAVLVHDAIDYMLTEADLAAAMQTAWAHCRPGGVVILLPDATAERFVPGTEHGGADAANGRGARYLAWSSDPDPGDSTSVTEYAFLLRDADGTTRVERETHVTGLFPRATWLRLLGAAGFDPRSVIEETLEERPPREIFIGERPVRA